MGLIPSAFRAESVQAKGADLAAILQEAKRMEQRAEEAAEQAGHLGATW